MDLRSSAAWSQFDEAIGHFGGEQAAAHAEPAVVSEDDLSDAGAPATAEIAELQTQTLSVCRHTKLWDTEPQTCDSQ